MKISTITLGILLTISAASSGQSPLPGSEPVFPPPVPVPSSSPDSSSTDTVPGMPPAVIPPVSVLPPGFPSSSPSGNQAQGSQPAFPGLRAVAPSKSTVSETAEPKTVPELVDDARKGIYRITVKDYDATGSVIGWWEGTGFLIDNDGHIVTNAHVANPERKEKPSRMEIEVKDFGDNRIPATIVGIDLLSDLAVLKISNWESRPIRFALPDELQVGEDVIAIGYGLGLQGMPSVTKGIISALDRVGGEENGVEIGGMIQTDAAINHGNSGGPLLNMQGQVVGINTSIMTLSHLAVEKLKQLKDNPEAMAEFAIDSQAHGMNYAVSCRVALPCIAMLILDHKVTRSYLGIVPECSIDPDKAHEANENNQRRDQGPVGVTQGPVGVTQGPVGVTHYLDQLDRFAEQFAEHGVIVNSVHPGSPAAKAGIQPGDVITYITNEDPFGAIARSAAGDSSLLKKFSRVGNDASVWDIIDGLLSAGGNSSPSKKDLRVDTYSIGELYEALLFFRPGQTVYIGVSQQGKEISNDGCYITLE